ANHMGYSSDSAVATQAEQGIRQGVFTAKDIKLFAERAGHLQQGHALVDIRCRVLHAYDVVDFSELQHGLNVNEASSTAWNVIQNNGQRGVLRNCLEMRHQAVLLRLIVIGGNLQRRSGTGLLGILGHGNGFAGGVRSGTSNHWHTPSRGLDDGLDDAVVLFVRQRWRFARGATGDKAVCLLLLNTVVDQTTQTIFVNTVVVFEGGNNRNVNARPVVLGHGVSPLSGQMEGRSADCTPTFYACCLHWHRVRVPVKHLPDLI